jgi:4-hydroxybenzoate polyprenyltransferase|tara:strand:- start:150 stop:1016 length:867 start_codon:yes stop_codon:yes gene_type:complete
MRNIILLIRPRQYIKNLFIFLPLFFVGQITNPELLLNAFIAFVAFSISASAIYILNDFCDIEEDQQHPEKKSRPLASGSISSKTALFLMGVLAISGISLMTALSFESLVALSGYILLNIAYSYYLKHIAILDVTIISIGFLLRIFVGAFVNGIQLSMWIVMMTFLLALFLAFAKRRDDLLIYLNTGKNVRKVISGYNIDMLNASMSILAAVVIVSYIMWTVSIDVITRVGSNKLYATTFFVILGILRYLQVIFIDEKSGSPSEVLLSDRLIQFSVLGWLAFLGIVLYT